MAINEIQTYKDAVDNALYAFYTLNTDLKGLCPYIFSSNMADVYWLTLWTLYHEGQAPCYVHKSRGNTWWIKSNGVPERKVEVIKADHRMGIKVY